MKMMMNLLESDGKLVKALLREVQPLKKWQNGFDIARWAGADKMEEEVPRFNQFDEDDDEFVENAWNAGWLRHYCAGGPTPGKMAEWFRYCKMAAGAR